MPMIDFICAGCGNLFEHFLHPSQATEDVTWPCGCGHRARRYNGIVQAPAVIWTGSVGQRYRDKDKPGYYQPDGVVQYTRKTPDGKPKAVHLDSWSDVKNFCKSEGLVDPREMGRNMTVTDNGQGKAQTLGYDKGATGTEV